MAIPQVSVPDLIMQTANAQNRTAGQIVDFAPEATAADILRARQLTPELGTQALDLQTRLIGAARESDPLFEQVRGRLGQEALRQMGNIGNLDPLVAKGAFEQSAADLAERGVELRGGIGQAFTGGQIANLLREDRQLATQLGRSFLDTSPVSPFFAQTFPTAATMASQAGNTVGPQALSQFQAPSFRDFSDAAFSNAAIQQTNAMLGQQGQKKGGFLGGAGKGALLGAGLAIAAAPFTAGLSLATLPAAATAIGGGAAAGGLIGGASSLF